MKLNQQNLFNILSILAIAIWFTVHIMNSNKVQPVTVYTDVQPNTELQVLETHIKGSNVVYTVEYKDANGDTQVMVLSECYAKETP